MGDIISEPTHQVNVAVVVEDPDASDHVAKLELFEDGSVVQKHEPNSASVQWQPKVSTGVGAHYYFVKVTQADGNVLWSAPIWLTVAE